jgi:hypothetical protein
VRVPVDRRDLLPALEDILKRKRRGS